MLPWHTPGVRQENRDLIDFIEDEVAPTSLYRNVDAEVWETLRKVDRGDFIPLSSLRAGYAPPLDTDTPRNADFTLEDTVVMEENRDITPTDTDRCVSLAGRHVPARLSSDTCYRLWTRSPII